MDWRWPHIGPGLLTSSRQPGLLAQSLLTPSLNFYTSSYFKYMPNKHIFAIWCLPPLHMWNLPANGACGRFQVAAALQSPLAQRRPTRYRATSVIPLEVLCPPPSLAGGPGLQSLEGFTLWGTSPSPHPTMTKGSPNDGHPTLLPPWGQIFFLELPWNPQTHYKLTTTYWIVI